MKKEREIETKKGDETKRHQTCGMASSNNVVFLVVVIIPFPSS
jgi:hypothetical protein